jgi:hypothetical protein
MFFFVCAKFHAQTVDDAKNLYAEKKYDAAAAIYYKLYLFNEAATAYQMQIDLLVNNKQTDAAESIKPLLMKSEKAARMVSRCEDIQIIDSVVVDEADFLTGYFLGEESGKLEKLQTSIVFENQLGDHRYFGKKNDDDHFRLNSQLKILDKWLEEKVLNLPDDSLSDDNYPFVMPDGLTIYFASTGNESIGGYDIFVSRYNMNNDTYLAPNQMGMPFNSIYNDYMLAIDETNNIGYFVTDRFQPEGKVIVYSFIPNEEFSPVKSEDGPTLINRTKITSIKDTWLQGVNYQAYLENVKTNIEKEKLKVKKDFTFVINDNIVYYVLDDFDSDAAKKSFLQAKTLQEVIGALEDQLDLQRKEYAKGSSAKKQTLSSSILEDEKQLETLYKDYKKAVIETRNLEIKYLKQKQ